LELADQRCDLLRLVSTSHFAKALLRAMENSETLLALTSGDEDLPKDRADSTDPLEPTSLVYDCIGLSNERCRLGNIAASKFDLSNIPECSCLTFEIAQPLID